jgi:metal-responsive CopG/Arc/MetJ family transcriptional regulator
VLDRIASKGNRSRLISQAVLHYVKTQSTANLKERLKQGALANAKLNLGIGEQWFSSGARSMAETRDEERAAKAKPTPTLRKSTSRRSIRR